MDYTVPAIKREFGSVFIGDKNVVALLVVAAGWAKVFLLLIWKLMNTFDLCFDSHIFSICIMQVREQGQQKGEASPFLAELL